MEIKTKTPKISNSFKKLGLTFLFILVFLWAGTSLTDAQQSVSPGFSIFPSKLEIEVERNQHLKEEINIWNKSKVAMPIEAKVLNFTAEDYTGTMIFDPGLPGASLERIGEDISFNPAKWITLENPYFILDPEGSEKVKVSIDIPENAEPGGHYAVILFEPKLPSFYFKEGQSRAIPIIGVLFLFSVEVEGLVRVAESLTIVEFTIPEDLHLKRLENLMANLTGLFTEALAAEKKIFTIVEASHLPFTLRIKNNDIYHIKPFGKLEILTTEGKKVGETEIKKTTILPGKIRNFPVEFKPDLPEILEKYLPASILNFISQNLLFGKFKANLLLEFESGMIKKEMDFWVFPWKAGLSTAFLLCLTMFLVVKYRKRISKALLVLFKK